MDWETFLQGVRDTRTGLWMVWLALAAVLLAALGVLMVVEPLGRFWDWWVAVFSGFWEVACRQDPLEVAAVVAYCILFLSVAALIALPLLFVCDRSRRSRRSQHFDTTRTARASTHNSPT